MRASKTAVIIFALCLVHQSVSKPTANNELNEGRGIGSTIWGWITYPFSWWSSGESEKPVTEQLIGSTTEAPKDAKDSIHIGNHNVTIWCNDQTCTTMKCDKFECRNITCNIYDTDLRGECREYNLIPEEVENNSPKIEDVEPKLPNNITVSVSETPQLSNANNRAPADEKNENPVVEEHPLELEAVLSSSVNNLDKGQQPESDEETNLNPKVQQETSIPDLSP